MKREAKQPADSEADRFIEFTRKIMSVPKEEIDKQQAIYERNKQRRKRQREMAEEN